MDKITTGRRRFIEEMGDLIDEHGLPRMAGRVVGALLTCSPPHMSLDELADALQASKGAISMSTQLLLRLGIIDRISLAGHRRHYYQIRPRMGESLFFDRADEIERHLAVIRRGIEQMKGGPIEAVRRLVEIQVFFEFVLEELSGISTRWAKRCEQLLRHKLDEQS